MIRCARALYPTARGRPERLLKRGVFLSFEQKIKVLPLLLLRHTGMDGWMAFGSHRFLATTRLLGFRPAGTVVLSADGSIDPWLLEVWSVVRASSILV